ncbi:hypothetical protein X777_16851 [Ooceraea biroi]|uniref:Uncharacterized protein n=1 Tax=Ooceraea biroi TaxID=2015173 RepID=A0A026WS87_OOCBI|nr:hypothetical protein X777_16851 [Ooceraea biroi]
MAADSGMETCPSPEIADSRKRPLDCDAENGATKRSHYGSVACTRARGTSKFDGENGVLIFDVPRHVFLRLCLSLSLVKQRVLSLSLSRRSRRRCRLRAERRRPLGCGASVSCHARTHRSSPPPSVKQLFVFRTSNFLPRAVPTRPDRTNFTHRSFLSLSLCFFTSSRHDEM